MGSIWFGFYRIKIVISWPHIYRPQHRACLSVQPDDTFVQLRPNQMLSKINSFSFNSIPVFHIYACFTFISICSISVHFTSIPFNWFEFHFHLFCLIFKLFFCFVSILSASLVLLSHHLSVVGILQSSTRTLYSPKIPTVLDIKLRITIYSHYSLI